MGVLIYRGQHSALNHVLDKPNGFQTHRFAAGIRAGNDEDAVAACKCDVQWNRLFALACKRRFQPGMNGVVPLEFAPLLDHWQTPVNVAGIAGFRVNEVEMSESVVRRQDFVGMGADIVGECGEDARDFTLLVELKLTYAVVGFDGFGRLDKYRLASRRNVVDDAVDTSFVARRHRHDKSAVADYGGGVVIDDTFLTAMGYDAAHNPVD